jgi:hypothetical protein
VPKRTNERQQIIELLKTMLAGAACTVTASKMLLDVITGAEREVDVVAEYDVDGDTFTQSFEVTSKSRRADLTWVEQLLKKHENLPTDHLYLVSWSGFTSTALKLADSNPGLFLVTPQVELGPDGPQVKTLYTDTVRLSPRKTVCLVKPGPSEIVRVVVEPYHDLYSREKKLLGSVLDLVSAMLADRAAVELVLREAHNYPDRANMRWFVLGNELEEEGLYLHHKESDELHAVTAVEVSGEILFAQEPLEMEVRDFLSHRFAHGQAVPFGATGLIVAVLNSQSEVTNLIARFPLPTSPPDGESVNHPWGTESL